MAIVFIDTNIVIDYLKERDNEATVEFVNSFDIVYINDVVIMDALIASTVIMYNIDLYTFNKKDFKYLKQVRLIG